MNDGDLPRRAIFNDADMKGFMESSTKRELLNFVEAMGKACASDADGRAAFDPSNPVDGLPPSMASLLGALEEMVDWVDDFPPTTSDAVRFGNPSFRLWHARLVERSEAIITVMLQSRDDGSTVEDARQKGKDSAAGRLHPKTDDSIQQVSCYLHDSFGHAIRLDFGTGHESSFLVFLLVLSKVKCLEDPSLGGPSLPTLRAITLSIFDQYLKVTRRLQTDYRLEPAGSHGVWGLDDYHCLPFYFGACQLQARGVSPQELSNPKCIMDDYTLSEYGHTFMYLGCIRYIRQLKQGVPFFESSPMLFDISQTLTSWDKVARGLLRMYQGEVLDKRQVVQHFLFSKLFPCTWTPSRSELVAPTDTFRSPQPGTNTTNTNTNNLMPTTRAPWATGSAPSNIIPTTRAPWATDAADSVETRAPWATK
jgi:serine/threonine-protein phosphatase 2A activator